jgi:hypothetical protein
MHDPKFVVNGFEIFLLVLIFSFFFEDWLVFGIPTMNDLPLIILFFDCFIIFFTVMKRSIIRNIINVHHK